MAWRQQFFSFIFFIFFISNAFANDSCKVDYSIANQWGNGFTAKVTLTNEGDAWSGWDVTWNMPSGQKITGLWKGKHTQSGSLVSVSSYSWNANVSTGSSVSFGFNGSYSGTNTLPSDVTVNGVLCSGQAEPPTEEEKQIVCEADYSIRTQWNTGFTADIKIKNQGAALSDWTATWTMPAGQKVGSGWNGSFTQTGDDVTVTNAGWNKNISSDGTLSFGFNGTYSGDNPIPIDLAIDGVTCSGQPDTVLVRPDAPTALAAEMENNTNALLTWEDNSDNEASFIIERRVLNNPWEEIEVTDADVTEYTDDTLAIGDTYDYRLKAKNETGESAYTETKTVTREDHSEIDTQVLVDNCSSCHGTDGTSAGPATPTLAGLSRDYIISTMEAYQSDERSSTIMGRLARGYTSEQIERIADYLSEKTFTAADQDTDTELVKLGREIHDDNCAVCHTNNGHDIVTTGSPLAGQWKLYIDGTLNDYLENPHSNIPETMLTQLNALESQYGATAISAITDFYAANPDDTTGIEENTDDDTDLDTGESTPDDGSDTGDDSTDNGDDSGDDGTNSDTEENDADTSSAPSSPTGSSATVSDNEKVTISWVDSSDNESGFKVERREDTEWVELGSVTADETSYEDSTVSAGSQYDYRITAYNDAGSSEPEETSATLLTVLAYGENEYTNQGCATCHGETGSGGFTNTPLTGFTTETLSNLTTITTNDMPPSAPESCVGNCAASIAQYIVDVLAANAEDDNSEQACTDVAPASPRSLRLLTRYEYQNTVNDLLHLSVDLIQELPDENRVEGYDNNIEANQVTSLRLEAFINKAEDLSAQAMSESWDKISPCQTTDTSCATQFISEFGKKAYRRPLTDDEESTYLAFFAQDSFSSAAEQTIMAMLSSPHMLYRSELGEEQDDGTYQLNAYEIASSLSYLFWGTMPDDELMELADKDELSTDAQRIAQAYRLLNDQRSQQQVGNFVGQWLLASNPYSLPEKDALVYPDYTDEVRASLSQEIVSFFNHVAFDSTQNYSELFSSDYAMVDSTLANFYSLADHGGNSFEMTPVNDGSRMGILSLGAVLAKYSNSNESHPFKRGSFFFERVLCHDLPAPENAGIVEAPELDEDATTRERFAAHSESDTSCYSCHQYLDGPGFGFENYDGSGVFRSTENGKTIDTAGILRGLETYTPDEEVGFTDLNELSSIVAESPTASQCIAKQYYTYVTGKEETAADSCAVDDFLETYKESGYNLQTMLLGIVNSPNFIKRYAQ